jgi:hypothetical protein
MNYYQETTNEDVIGMVQNNIKKNEIKWFCNTVLLNHTECTDDEITKLRRKMNDSLATITADKAFIERIKKDGFFR